MCAKFELRTSRRLFWSMILWNQMMLLCFRLGNFEQSTIFGAEHKPKLWRELYSCASFRLPVFVSFGTELQINNFYFIVLYTYTISSHKSSNRFKINESLLGVTDPVVFSDWSFWDEMESRNVNFRMDCLPALCNFICWYETKQQNDITPRRNPPTVSKITSQSN